MTTVLQSLNEGLRRCMEQSNDVYLLGEDILDPYGGAFKVTQGLSTAFPARVMTTPISEAGFIGVGVGMALRGLRPVVEIMFGDFVTLGADQLINYAAKMRWMSADQARVPVVVRTPMGGRRGYGPTHSQSLEKHFLGVPGLRVVAINHCVPPHRILEAAVLQDEDPTLLIEHKLLYGLDVLEPSGQGEFSVQCSKDGYPICRIALAGAPKPGVTIAAYGYAVHLAMQAVQQLGYEHEVFAEIAVPTQLSPLRTDWIANLVRSTRRLVTVEEAPGAYGWGAEILASLSVLGLSDMYSRRVAAKDMPIPASGPLEEDVLPQIEDIVAAVLALHRT